MLTLFIPTAPAAGGIFAAIAAVLIAAAAWRTSVLTRTGAGAAVAVGAATAWAGGPWALLLLFFFLSSIALSRIGGGRARQQSEGIVVKPGARDAAQVFANGGIFAACAVAARMTGSSVLTLTALGALATATADTWATEVGVALGGTPRSIVGLHIVAPGTSGGISVAGTVAGCAGSVAIAIAAATVCFDYRALPIVAIGGMAGMFADSLLGATVQSQEWCERCNQVTEQRVHRCGSATRHRRGWRHLDNDGVNALATLVGALAAAALGSAALAP